MENNHQEDLLYVGTDDGSIHVTEDAGKSWYLVNDIKDVPKNTYVNSLVASKHDVNRVYVVFNNHKRGDFKPYVYVSNDKGKTWKSIVYNLPIKQSVYDIAEDHLSADLLFVGTELGVFYTNKRGLEWKQLKSGLPTIAVRDLEIQERESDLVLATFGRSFYVLDDYSPLRAINPESDINAKIFPIKDALMYIDSRPLGLRGKGSQGESHFTSKNPPLGAVITYYFNDTLKTSKQIRQKSEKSKIKNNQDVSYPTIEQLRKEDREQKPYLLFTIYDEEGKEIRKILEKPKLGVNRLVWNFRLTPQSNIKLKSSEPGRYGESNSGPLALPGSYFVTMHKVVNGETTLLVNKTSFNCKWLDQISIPADNKEDLLSFQQKVDRLRKAIDAAGEIMDENKQRINFITSAFKSYPGLDISYLSQMKKLEQHRDEINISLYGDPSLGKRDIEQNEAIASKVGIIIWNMWRNRSNPTSTNKMLYESASNELENLIFNLKELDENILKIEKYLEENEVPFTPGRGLIMNWKKE